MSFNIKRYVAEIEHPEGYISIDCEVKEYDNSTIKKLYFVLNQNSLNQSIDVENEDRTEFREILEREYEVEIQTGRDDIESYIEELLKQSYGSNAEITVRDVDVD